jgi:hypothetical protein
METQTLNQYIQSYRQILSNKIAAYFDWTIAYGPLKSMKFVQDSHWGSSDKGTMILGLYEQEILDELTSLPPDRKVFINLGAGDGYYGVGVVKGGIFEKSYCYELSAKGRDVVKRTAELNQVEDRVIIRGQATRNFVNEIFDEGLSKSVVLSDIEGCEFDIFNESCFEKLRDTIIIIELHDGFFSDGDVKIKAILDASSSTHKVKHLTMGARDLSQYPELATWSDNDRWLLCSEDRPYLMKWIRLDPI